MDGSRTSDTSEVPRPGAALPPPSIPESADELTPEWLTAALRARGVLQGARVKDVRREILGEGEGFIGQIVRLHLRLDRPEEGAPDTLIAKLPIGLDQNRALGELLGAYEREIRFYEELAGEVGLRSPRCYYAAMDPNPFAGREERALRLFQRIPTWLLRFLLPRTWRRPASATRSPAARPPRRSGSYASWRPRRRSSGTARRSSRSSGSREPT
jgi:hypothetical protein